MTKPKPHYPKIEIGGENSLLSQDAKIYAYQAGVYREMLVKMIRLTNELLDVAPHILKWQVIWMTRSPTNIPPIRKHHGSISNEDAINIILAKYGSILGILDDAMRLVEKGARHEES